MRYTAKLLKTTRQSITSIAEKVGIYDDNYFSRLFKQHMETTPSKTRNTQKKS